VLVGIVLDGPRVAAGFLDRVLSYHFVSITWLLLTMCIPGLMIHNSVWIVILGICLGKRDPLANVTVITKIDDNWFLLLCISLV
jgi:hypothetical protein